MNKLIVVALVGLFLMSGVYAVSFVEFYYSPTCPHCQAVSPFISELSAKYNFLDWRFYNVAEGSYAIDGVPTLIIDKTITLKGSYEIPRYLECYLKEQSSLNCPTKSADTCTNDWFIRE